MKAKLFQRKKYMSALLVITILNTMSLNCGAQKLEYVLSEPGDTTKNFYIAVHPEGQPKGSLVLLPGFGELPNQTFIESDIPKLASRAGYLTIIPALGDWSFFYVDDRSHQHLQQFIAGIFRKYQMKEDNFFIGGFSFGGTMAIQYTQRSYAQGAKLKKPAAVFAVDPPLDLERLYTCMTSKNRPPKNAISDQEDRYISERIKREFKTDPKTNPEFFWEISPYAQSDIQHRSLLSLLTIPLRIYNEPDIRWYMENRNIDYACMNAFDSAAMINWLRHRGNAKAELVITSDKGYRMSTMTRHPHSWTIVDGENLIQWLDNLVRGEGDR